MGRRGTPHERQSTKRPSGKTPGDIPPAALPLSWLMAPYRLVPAPGSLGTVSAVVVSERWPADGILKREMTL